MRNSVTVIFIPNEAYPWDVFFVVELAQVLHKQSIILKSKVYNPETSFFLLAA
jgi:hypothetical protein